MLMVQQELIFSSSKDWKSVDSHETEHHNSDLLYRSSEQHKFPYRRHTKQANNAEFKPLEKV